jgi:hypothetical protein
MFSGLPPKSDIRSARQRVRTTSRSGSRNAFALRARSTARRSARIISSGAALSGIPMPGMLPDKRAFAREGYQNF